MQLLPLEDLLLIIELSSGFPTTGSLAALARAHSTYQREAERALYDSLSIYDYSDYSVNSLKCLETVATLSEKAALVRFLTIEHAHDIDINRLGRVTSYLSKNLTNMHTVSDFRIRCRPGHVAMMKGLGKILWSVC